MKSVYVTCILLFLVSPILAQPVEIPRDPKRTPPVISTADIVKRYKVGDKWQSLSVFRINGKGSSTDWGIKGDVEFMQSNRYHTRLTVLESQEFGETLTLTLQCDVLDASSSKVFTKKKLRLVGFDSNDVLFTYAFNEAVNAAGKIYPPLNFVITLAQKLKVLDPEYERSLTTVANRLGLEPEQLISAKELEWFEEPRIYSGCSFKLKWVKEFGVVEAEQINGPNEKAPKLSVEDVLKWAVGADPLAELYIDPSLRKKVGDSWTLDAAQATPLFAGQGGARSTGKINVRYESDGTYAGSAVRNVLIQNGNIEVTLDDDNTATRYQLNSMEGNIKLDNGNGTLLMANGTGQISYSRKSKDHFLFKAEVSRDVSGNWRYEAKRMEK